MNPYPKPIRERLGRNTRAWEIRIDELYKRENSTCQGCGKWLFRNEAAPHHKTTYGAGGGDELENLMLLCVACHNDIHN